MKELILLLLLIGLLSCQENKPKIESIEAENLTTKQVDSILTEYKFQYESPIVIDSTNQILIPISTELLERRIKYSRDGYQSNDYPRYWNVLFYNRKSGETRLLTKDKIRISEIYPTLDQYREGGEILEGKILYQITNIDYNKDKKLNGNDPEYLFSSEINGENLVRISPRNEDLQYFKVIPKSEQIMIKTLRDTNQDLIFGSEDESIWYKAELGNNGWEIKEVIDSLHRKKIKNLYFEQWLKRK